MLGHGASAGSVWLMRFMDPGEVIVRRRANYERLAARLRGHVRVPFPELPAGACPLFLPVMVPGKVQVQEQLAARGVSSVDLWDASHPTCPPDLAEEMAGWRRECLELPIHQELGPADVDRVGDAVLAVLGRVH
jgi:dTDP-4-amino-4,6-dideoxygalactose transaminase